MTRRVLAAILLVATLALVGFAIPLGVAIRRLYSNEELVRLERQAAAATIEVPTKVHKGGRPTDLPDDAHGTHYGLYLPTGSKVQGIGPASADLVVREARHGRVSDGLLDNRMVVAVPVTSRERVIAIVRAERSLNPVTHRTRVTWAWMLLLAFTVLLLAGLGAMGLARRLVRPVAALADAATRLGDGDFAVRTARSGISEVDRAAAALDSTAERLGAVLERERSFSADASHQLRTPLTALRVHLAAASDHSAEDAKGDLAQALADVDRLERTVNDLITLARDVRVADDVDVERLLPEVRRTWEPRFTAAGRSLVVSLPEQPVPLRISRPAIEQILDVLLSNAERHGAGTVTVVVRDIPAGVALEVSDEGPRVEGDPDALFTRRSAAAKGHGIGLALARSLAEAEGGRLFLRTDAPTTTFALLFPSADL